MCDFPPWGSSTYPGSFGDPSCDRVSQFRKHTPYGRRRPEVRQFRRRDHRPNRLRLEVGDELTMLTAHLQPLSFLYPVRLHRWWLSLRAVPVDQSPILELKV